MKVIISPKAEKQLKKIGKVDQIAIAKKIREIAEKDIGKKEKLKGYKNIFRFRVGDYRLVYRKTRRELYIVLIGHRRDVYKAVKKLFN
jgi:mRNA interferase RelE/StbE